MLHIPTLVTGSAPVQFKQVARTGPAQRAGVRAGDRVVAVNGTAAVFLSHREVVQLIKDSGETPVHFLLLSPCERPRLLPQISPSYVPTDELGFELELSEPLLGRADSCDSFDSETTLPAPPSAGMRHRHSSSPHAEPISVLASSQQLNERWLEYMARSNATVRAAGSTEQVWLEPTLPTETTTAATTVAPTVDESHLLGLHLPVPAADDRLASLLIEGVPHALRRQVWLRCSGAAICSAKTALRYDELARCAEFCLQGQPPMVQIEKDLMRTFPNNIFFSAPETEGVLRLRRVLQTFAWVRPEIGYCQGMGMIAGTLLLVMTEEEAFWCLLAILTWLLPEGQDPRHWADLFLGLEVALTQHNCISLLFLCLTFLRGAAVDYFTSTLRGVMVDQRVLMWVP